jgi:hypothetical protein
MCILSSCCEERDALVNETIPVSNLIKREKKRFQLYGAEDFLKS